MFVQDFRVIDAPCRDVVSRLVVGRERIFREALGSSRSTGERVVAKVRPRSWPCAFGKAVEIRLGPIRRSDVVTLVAFSWVAHGGESLFPRLDADVEVAPFGPDQTVLTVRGTYDPPAGWPGRIADDLLLHHIAESTVRAFLEALGNRLASGHRDGAGDGPRS